MAESAEIIKKPDDDVTGSLPCSDIAFHQRQMTQTDLATDLNDLNDDQKPQFYDYRSNNHVYQSESEDRRNRAMPSTTWYIALPETTSENVSKSESLQYQSNVQSPTHTNKSVSASGEELVLLPESSQAKSGKKLENSDCTNSSDDPNDDATAQLPVHNMSKSGKKLENSDCTNSSDNFDDDATAQLPVHNTIDVLKTVPICDTDVNLSLNQSGSEYDADHETNNIKQISQQNDSITTDSTFQSEQGVIHLASNLQLHTSQRYHRAIQETSEAVQASADACTAMNEGTTNLLVVDNFNRYDDLQNEHYMLQSHTDQSEVAQLQIDSQELWLQSDLQYLSLIDLQETSQEQTDPETLVSQLPVDAQSERSFALSGRLNYPIKGNKIPHSIVFNHNGGQLISQYGDIKVIIPKGAIYDGDLIAFFISVDLYAPFALPSQSQTDLASPYYWIGISGSYYFQQPIQIEFQHYGACDPSHYQLLSCKDDDKSYTMRTVDYELSFKKEDDKSWCIFQTSHLCSYCLQHDCPDPPMNSIGVYYLQQQHFQFMTYFKVEVWFSFPISYCLDRNKELYTDTSMMLESSDIFETSSDNNSTSYFTLQHQDNDGWDVKDSRTTVRTKDVNFYNRFKDSKTLKKHEEHFLFPPRFTINVVKKSDCTKDLNIDITITLHEEDNTDKYTRFKLFVPLATKSRVSQDKSSLSIASHSCDKHKPTLRKLVLYSEKISLYWKEIGLILDIAKHTISTIELDHKHSTKDMCFCMFETWLQRIKSPCWCHFIQALIDVQLMEVAEEVQKELQNPHDNVLASIASSDSNAGKNATHMVIQGDTLNFDNLTMYLKDVPQNRLLYFAGLLLPKTIVKEIRNRTAVTDLLENICMEFLNDPSLSWLKVYKALKQAKCDDIANRIEAGCLPI